MNIGFDNEKYQNIQSEHIKERISQFDGKLYLELGGKLFDDHHASRVLPGFQPDSKLRMFQKISDSIEIVIVISAADIEKNRSAPTLASPTTRMCYVCAASSRTVALWSVRLSSLITTDSPPQSPSSSVLSAATSRPTATTLLRATRMTSSSSLRQRLWKERLRKDRASAGYRDRTGPAAARWLYVLASSITRTSTA